MSMDTNMQEHVAAALSAARCAVALTGAGISTESGLPDYRGSAGLWRNRRFEELASIEHFRSEPVAFWEFYRARLDVLAGAEPNAAHRALAALEQRGNVARIITQNVDGLHHAAGSDALEVHGSLRTCDCLACARRVSTEQARARMVEAPDGVPRCECGDVLKPSVVLFGELLPPAIEDAMQLAQRADVMLVCGSSLAVAPVSHLPLITLAAGGTLIIVNDGPTELDQAADLRLAGRLAEELPKIVACMT